MPNPQQPDLFPVGRKGKRRNSARIRDRVFDGVAVACGYELDRISEIDGKIIGPVAASLRTSGVEDTEAGFEQIQAVGKAYEADRKMAEYLVAGCISPPSLAKHWHALVQRVKPRKSNHDRVTSAICRGITEQQMNHNKGWWQRRWAIAHEIVHRDLAKSEAQWAILREIKPAGMKKSSTMQNWLGVIADLVSPGELARRMETDKQEYSDEANER